MTEKFEELAGAHLAEWVLAPRGQEIVFMRLNEK
jgi:hypothetical protein